MHSAYIFDAYGTLFDVHAATRKYADDLGPDHAALSEVWRNKQLEYTWTRTMMGRYVDFWELTQQALDFAFERFPEANKATRPDLLDAYWQLESFSEVAAVLESLKNSGVSTGILSNGSTEMLQAAVDCAGLTDLLDIVVSVDRIRQFKASPAVYQMVVDDLRIYPDAVSFQSSNRWDIAAAKAFGFRTVWCNRGNMPDEYTDLSPDLVLADLSGLIGRNGKPV